MEREMIRNRKGQFVGAAVPGFGMVQTDIPLDVEDEVQEVEKAFERTRANFHHSRSRANDKKTEKTMGRFYDKVDKDPKAARREFYSASKHTKKTQSHFAAANRLDSIANAKAMKKKGIIGKADSRPFRDPSKGEMPYRRSDAHEGLGYSAAGSVLAGGVAADNIRAARKNGKAARALSALPPRAGRSAYAFADAARKQKKVAIGYGALAAGFGAGAAAFGHDIKRGGTKKHRFNPEVNKAMPGLSDVHIEGVLRPVGKLRGRKVEKAWSKSKTYGAATLGLTGAGAVVAGYKGQKEAKRLGPKTMKSLSTKEKVFGVRGGMARLAGTEREDLSKAFGGIGAKQVMRPATKMKVGSLGGFKTTPNPSGPPTLSQSFGRKPNALMKPAQTTRSVTGGRVTDTKTRGSLTTAGKVTAGGTGSIAAGFGANQFMQQRKQRMGMGTQGR